MMGMHEYRISKRFLKFLARHIPFQAMLSEHDVMTSRGELLRIWRLCDAAAPPEARWLHQHRTSLCAPLQRVTDGRFALWLHRLPERSASPADSLEPASCDPPSATMQQGEIYISMLIRPGWRARFGRHLPLRSTARHFYANAIRLMDAATATVAEQLEHLQPHLLGDYFVAGRHHNEAFDLLSFLVNGVWTSRPVAAGQLQRTLPCEHLLQSQLNSGLTTCANCRNDLHPFPDGVWSEQLCCGTPGLQ